jgi:hypothetical protein
VCVCVCVCVRTYTNTCIYTGHTHSLSFQADGDSLICLFCYFLIQQFLNPIGLNSHSTVSHALFSRLASGEGRVLFNE